MTEKKNAMCLIPSLSLEKADKAIELYKQAFGAIEEHKMLCPDTGVVAHCGLKIGDGMIFIGEAKAEMGCPASVSPTFYLYVPDADKAIEKAVKSGMTEAQKAEDMFWGDRMGVVTDAFGVKWSLATQVREVSEKDMIEGMKQMKDKTKSKAA